MVFVTFSLPMDLNPERATLQQLLDSVRGRVTAIATSVMSGLRNRSNICMVALYQSGEEHGHSHIHMIVDQSKQKIVTNGTFFDLFARNTDEPVLKTVWNFRGLMRYLLKEGTLVVYTHNDTLLEDDFNEPDAPTEGPRGKENLRQVVKRVLDSNPKMDLKSLNQYCLRNHFGAFDQHKVQTAFQNWVSKRVYDSQKEDITGQDPIVTLAVLTWIGYQRSTRNIAKCLTNPADHPHPAYYYIYDFFTKICNRTRKPQDDCLWMTGRPGIGKTNCWQWINFALDPFLFNPGAQGVGKYDRAEAKKIAISDDTPIHLGQVNDAQYSTLLNLMSGNNATIKLHGRTSQNSFPMYVMFISNDYPQCFYDNFKRRIRAIEVKLPYKDFWQISSGRYNNALLYNYFKQAYTAFNERGKYMCYCACLKHSSLITCQEYDSPSQIVCSEFNLLCLNYNEEQGISFPPNTDPFSLYQCLQGISLQEDRTSTQSSAMSDLSNQ